MEFNLGLVTDIENAREYIRGVLWTIFFHRLFGSIVPQDQHDFLGVPYPSTDYPDLERAIESKIDDIVRALSAKGERERHPYEGDAENTNNRDRFIYGCVIVVKFYEEMIQMEMENSGIQNRQESQSRSGSSSSSIMMTPRVQKYANCWETWILQLTVLDRQGLNLTLLDLNGKSPLDIYREKFEGNVLKIIESVDKNKDHIPRIKLLDKAPFPYKVLFALNTCDAKSLDSAFASFEMSQHPSQAQTNSDYVVTTNAGDLIMGDTQDYTAAREGSSSTRGRSSGEVLFRNSYKFLKKFLE